MRISLGFTSMNIYLFCSEFIHAILFLFNDNEIFALFFIRPHAKECLFIKNRRTNERRKLRKTEILSVRREKEIKMKVGILIGKRNVCWQVSCMGKSHDTLLIFYSLLLTQKLIFLFLLVQKDSKSLETPSDFAFYGTQHCRDIENEQNDGDKKGSSCFSYFFTTIIFLRI